MLAKATADGITPLEVMITAMRNAWAAGNIGDAVQHAVHAAPYVHPRLASSEMKLDDKRTVRDYTTAELEAILAANSDGASDEAEVAEQPDSLH